MTFGSMYVKRYEKMFLIVIEEYGGLSKMSIIIFSVGNQPLTKEENLEANLTADTRPVLFVTRSSRDRLGPVRKTQHPRHLRR